MDITQWLKDFSQTHTIFHSEADFQFKFAWFLKGKYQKEPILEKPFAGNTNNKRIYVDIIIGSIAIELKYKTAKLEVGEYDLTNHAAPKDATTAFENDQKKIKHLIKHNGMEKGYCIFLTNDKAYWGGGDNAITAGTWQDFSTVGEGDNEEFRFFIKEIPEQN